LLGQLRKDSTDLLIVDWQVSDVPAAELLRRAKEKLAPNTPTMFLAGSSAEDDIVAGVTAGADDYLVKPLRRGELVARTQALLRRAYPSQNGAEQLQFGPYIFETRPGRLMMDGEQIDVTHKEFNLALLFFRNLGRPLSRAYIHESGCARRPSPRVRWTPTSRACATNCACVPRTVSASCRYTAMATGWKSWARETLTR
jgi:DNA-binding response OmpR family regulator